MNQNPILAALVVAGQPQFMALFLGVVFLCAGLHLLRQARVPERAAGPVSAGIGVLLMIATFIGIKLYIQECAATADSVRLPQTVWSFTLMGFVAAMVTCAHSLRGGLLQSTAATATGCGILLSGSLSLATGCGALHLGVKSALYKAMAALFEVSTVITAVFIVAFIVSLLVPTCRRWRSGRRLAIRKKARV